MLTNGWSLRSSQTPPPQLDDRHYELRQRVGQHLLYARSSPPRCHRISERLTYSSGRRAKPATLSHDYSILTYARSEKCLHHLLIPFPSCRQRQHALFPLAKG